MKTTIRRKAKTGGLSTKVIFNGGSHYAWSLIREQPASARVIYAVFQKAPATSSTFKEGVLQSALASRQSCGSATAKFYEDLVTDIPNLHFNFQEDICEEEIEEEDSSTGEISAFLNVVYDLAKRGKEDYAIDVVFEHINNLLVERQFDTCDQILSEVEIAKIPPVLMVSFLTITAAAKPQLENRSRFYRITRRLVAHQRGQKAADRLLDGLE